MANLQLLVHSRKYWEDKGYKVEFEQKWLGIGNNPAVQDYIRTCYHNNDKFVMLVQTEGASWIVKQTKIILALCNND